MSRFRPSWVPVVGLFACAMAGSACSEAEKSPAGRPNGGPDEAQHGPLRSAANSAKRWFGTAANFTALRDEPIYAELLGREFDYLTPENEMKWGPLMPGPDRYEWQAADAIVEFAERHDQAVKGHTFVWHEQTPSWLAALSADELRAAIKSHIETTMGRYKGRVRAWDVVNEAVDTTTQSGYRESIFWQKLGPSYIEDAFRWARAADPDALLFYNEVGIERAGPKSDFTYALMRDLLDKGIPIDGIGFQSHISIHRYPPLSNLRENIRRFAELGLSVNISELDARTLLMPGTREVRWEAQRIAFQQVVSACVSEPACESVTLWGFTDKHSWINAEGADDPLIFDRDYRPKPSYDGVLDGLSGRAPALGANVVENGDFAQGNQGWSASAGTLTVSPAVDRDGTAACVSSRGAPGDSLVQSVLDPLRHGGPFALTSQVRVRGAATAPVYATLTVEEPGAAPVDLSLATIIASDTAWLELAGYFGVGFTSTPTRIDLRFHEPPADVELCVTDVRLHALSAR